MATKRANGEGSVFRRKDGLWSAELTLASGKRKTFYAKTRTLVLEKRKDFITDQRCVLETVHCHGGPGEYDRYGHSRGHEVLREPCGPVLAE